jgi:hypothetical protein
MSPIMPLINGESLRVLHAGSPEQDEYGNDIPSPPTEQTVHGCAVWPGTAASDRASKELVGERNSVTYGLVVFLPAGVVITPADQVIVRGALYEVDGEPGAWRSYLTGTVAGTQVSLRRVEG